MHNFGHYGEIVSSPERSAEPQKTASMVAVAAATIDVVLVRTGEFSVDGPVFHTGKNARKQAFFPYIGR